MTHDVRNRGPLRVGLAVAGGLATVLWAGPALSHPHVYVIAQSTINIEQGAIASFDHVWTFDEFYSAMAVQDLDKNKDGKIDRAELAELTKLNIEGLKEFKYFTFPTLAGKELGVLDPKDGEAWSEHKDGILSLHFKARLEKPVLAEAQDFALSIQDPSYFIAFEYAKTDPVKLAPGAPKNCTAGLEEVKKGDEAAKKLGEAFFEQLGGANFGIASAKIIRVNCK